MKRVFVYGILQQCCVGKDFGIMPSDVIGKARLYNFRRISLSFIQPSDNQNDYVEGELVEIPDELEEKINQFESQFGYKRNYVNVRMDDGKYYNAIAYLKI